MRILYLARYLPETGSTIHMYTLSKDLVDQGHEVYMLSSGPNEEDGAVKLYNEAIHSGLKHKKVPFPNKPKYTRWGKCIQFIQYMSAMPIALFMIYRIKPDVVHVHYPVVSYIANLYKVFTKKKFITTYHTSGIPKHPLHKKADFAVAISSELRKELAEDYGYREGQIRLIFNGVPREKFDISAEQKQKISIKKELGLPTTMLLIGFVGSLYYKKGIDVLLKACSTINQEFRVLLIGDGDASWVNTLIDQNGLNGKVSVYPFQDPIKFYEILDVFVLPSRQEGFGLVSIEAMMSGIPTIRSDVEGAKDQINHGINGYLFRSEDANELKKYIERLLDDEKLRKSMGEAGREQALSKFTDEVMVDKLMLLYQEVNGD